MKVALTAEGTYPHQFGGVSVWCDQLIRAMSGYEFAVVALVATGTEPVQWELPANVSQLMTIPLWGPPPPVPLRARLPRGRVVPLPVQALVDVLLDKRAEASDRFGTVLGDVIATSTIWLNGEPADADAAVGPDDEVAVLPPVSGG